MLIFSIFPFRLKSHIKIVRDTKTAEKRLINKPKISVTANPRIGPEPYIYKITDEMIVVICVSIIVIKARPNPRSIEVGTSKPRCNSSLIRSKIKTFESTAIPILKIKPAIPGKVSVAPRTISAASVRIIFKSSATTALTPAPR